MGIHKQSCTLCGELGHRRDFHKDETSTDRICYRCKISLPLDRFYSTVKKNQKTLHYSHVCKECNTILSREGREKSLESKVKRLFNQIVARSKRKNWDLDLTTQDILEQIEQQKGLCFYTGEELSSKDGQGGLSIDRIDSSIGYRKGNIAVTSWKVNRIKSNLSMEEFVDLCRTVSDHFGPNKVLGV